MTRRRRLAPGVVLGGFAAVWIAAARVPYDRAALEFGPGASQRVTARDGTPLRVTLGAAGARAEWRALDAISPRLVDATLAAEDRRFWHHPGIDPLALARAAWTDARAHRIVAGGSTLTQQLSGLLWPEPRTLGGKWREAVRAVRLERDLPKRAILEQYLNRVPYSPSANGIAAASRALLGREPAALSASQAATLAALPQSPTRFARAGGQDALRRRRDAILEKMARQRRLSPEELADARRRDLEIELQAAPFVAPHFADWVLATLPPSLQRAARIETTLDPELQQEVEGIVDASLEALRGYGVHQMAVVVEDLATNEVRALVGSPAWEDAQVNGALALRQPGSALKPFVYAQAFAAGMSAADRLADLPLVALDAENGAVSPRNYDGRWHGPVRIREALASSFNVPAVRLQQQLGSERVLRGLRAAGLASLDADAGYYGLGLVLGDGEVSLLDLTNAYAGLARGGEWMEPARVRAASDARGRSLALPESARRRWLDPAAAFLVADVLADDHARIPGFGPHSVLDLPFAVAVKTGTSTDYRNSWCIGFSRDHVVGIWVGNFDATPIHGLAGATGAGPVFRAVMLRLREHGSRPWSPVVPPGWTRQPVCALSGDVPGPACSATVLEWFAPGAYARRARCAFHVRKDGCVVVEWPPEYRDWAQAGGLASATAGESELVAANFTPAATPSPPRILSPVDGSVYFRDPRLTASAIRFDAEAADGRDLWILDGRRIPAGPGASGPLWAPEPGEHRLQLRRGAAIAEVRFSVR